MRFDKIKVLLVNAATFTISDIFADITGEEKNLLSKTLQFKSGGVELNAYSTGFDTDWITSGNWVNNGGVLETMPSGEESYPAIHNIKKHISLGFDSEYLPYSIEKTFSFTPQRNIRKVYIRVIARVFPKIFDTSKTPDSWHTNLIQIKPDSYDYGTLCIGLSANTANAESVHRRLVDIGFSEVWLEAKILPNQDELTVKLWRSEQDVVDSIYYRNHLYPLHIYDVSVQI